MLTQLGANGSTQKPLQRYESCITNSVSRETAAGAGYVESIIPPFTPLNSKTDDAEEAEG